MTAKGFTGTDTASVRKSINDTLKMYVEVDRMEAREGLLEELVIMVDVIVDEAFDEGYTTGYNDGEQGEFRE